MPGLFNGFCSGFGGYSPIASSLTWMLSIGLVVVLVLLLVRSSRRPGGGRSYPPASSAESAREILQIRYARGELTHEQYQLMRKHLHE